VDRLDADPAFDPLPVPERQEEVSEEVQLLAYQGQFLPAIRLLLRQTGLGLKESREIVQQLPVDPDLPPRRSASLFVIMAIAIALLGLGMAFAILLAQA
jgi:hypothetical protein